VYINDVLIYTNSSCIEYKEHMKKVLVCLLVVGLYLDINKCEFKTKSTKYLGFIIKARKGVQIDPKKVKAI
jgi:hypothetical protein